MASDSPSVPTKAPNIGIGIGLWGAVAVVLGNVIGSTIFISLSFQSKSLPDAFSILSVWVTGAFIAWCGAVSYAELTAIYPQNGGEAHFLEKIYHPVAGFLSGWVSLLAGFPAPVAAVALIFGKYAALTFFPPAEGGAESFLWTAKGIAAALIIGTTAVHCFNLKRTDRFHQLATYSKLALLIILTVAIWICTPEPQTNLLATSERTWSSFGTNDYFVQVYYVLYAYAGWNAACYIAGEVRDAPRTIPKALFWGLALASLFYLAFNYVILRAVPLEDIQNNPEFLQTATQRCFGPLGAKLSTSLICLGMVSSVSAMLWVGSRVAQKCAARNLLLLPLNRPNAAGIPVRSLIFQCLVALGVLFLFPDPDAMILYVQFLLQVAAFCAVLGVFVLRIRQPLLPRPYKAFGYPVVPAIFLIWTIIATNHFLNLYGEIVGKGLITLAVGIAVWFAGKMPQAKNATKR